MPIIRYFSKINQASWTLCRPGKHKLIEILAGEWTRSTTGNPTQPPHDMQPRDWHRSDRGGSSSLNGGGSEGQFQVGRSLWGSSLRETLHACVSECVHFWLKHNNPSLRLSIPYDVIDTCQCVWSRFILWKRKLWKYLNTKMSWTLAVSVEDLIWSSNINNNN